ncbi:hypothetical protein MUCCIDRAFT_107546 [Mucor lusitanicus CBS 277.49]|uniref:DNA polymerase delta subunit 3 n=1 Tax=Mucor lusitanicus CBS 277.49 TaxID=747725 RepID=A0A162QZP1_MUCCL|nr:hypothetical protein MUCCIDRAFT_107546 [Mucor lusitanicus CBS 277.49]
MSDYNEYLSITVLQENKPVTYKSLARALGMHVNKAKQALYEFSESQSNVRAVYCITGTSLKSNQFTIQLVKDAELDDAKKGYKEITGIHVYSITSFDPDDFSIFYTACKEAPQLALEDRVKCGILKNANVVLQNIVPTNRAVEGEKKSAPTSNTKSLSSNTSTKPTTLSSSTSKATSSTTTTTTTTTTGKRKGTLNFGPASTKKQIVTASPKSEAPVSKPAPKKSINKMKPKNDQDVRMAKTSIKASDIFSDDEEEEEEEHKEPQPAEDIDVLEIDDGDEDMEVVEAAKEEEPVQEEEEPSTPAPPGKARRKVLKKRTTKNSRGHLVTEEYWDWEVVDASEVQSTVPTTPFKSKAPSTTTTASAAKKPTNNKNAKNAKKPTGQPNLFSFFKKA